LICNSHSSDRRAQLDGVLTLPLFPYSPTPAPLQLVPTEQMGLVSAAAQSLRLQAHHHRYVHAPIAWRLTRLESLARRRKSHPTNSNSLLRRSFSPRQARVRADQLLHRVVRFDNDTPSLTSCFAAGDQTGTRTTTPSSSGWIETCAGTFAAAGARARAPESPANPKTSRTFTRTATRSAPRQSPLLLAGRRLPRGPGAIPHRRMPRGRRLW
jgi:hypothetical protein